MKILSRLTLLVVILLAVTLAFIYITVEKEKKLKEEIIELHSLIRPQVETISKLDGEIAEISLTVESITDAKKGHVNRQDMLEIMDLNVEAYRLIEKRQKAECQKLVYENALRSKQKRIDALRSKFFMKIFLR